MFFSVIACLFIGYFTAIGSMYAKADEQKIEQNYVVQNPSSEILSKSEVEDLNNMLTQFAESTDKKTGKSVETQYVVYVTDSLNGDSIEDYSQRKFNELQVGGKEHNKGIMFVIAIDDREYRVQLGDGWANEYLDEDNIKDYAFNDSLTDMLRNGNYYGGIKSVVQQTIGLAGLSINVQPKLQSYVSAAEKWKDNKEEEEGSGKKFVIMFALMLAGAALIYFGTEPVKF